MNMTALRLPLTFLLVYCTSNQCIFGQSVPQIIKGEGYPVQKHTVTTQDDYILTVYRIPSGRDERRPANNVTKPVVLLQHGFASSSDCWVLSGRRSALGFLLADRGYDVWLANARGTIDSTNHTRLDVHNPDDKKEFDKYSFHEKGTMDLPATIDYILEVTGKKTLAMYAHSEGASMFYALAATAPAETNKINSFFGFAPLVFIGNVTSPVVKIAAQINWFYLGGIMHKVATPVVQIFIKILDTVTSNIFMRQFASKPIEFISGGNGQISGGTASKIYKYFPSYISPKSLFHILQLVSSSNFQQYKHAIWNPKRIFSVFRNYEYNLKNVVIPMYLYFSPDDMFINERNLNRFNAAFTRKPKVFKVHSNRKFGHYDLVYGNDANKVYALTYDALKKHTAA